MIERITVETDRRGLHEITAEIARRVAASGIASGLCTLFLQHTSASLTIQENADPSARRDLEAWMDRLVPDADRRFTHTAEGPDDMPSHIKAALTGCALSIPILEGHLALGTWQGIYLWEHRTAPHRRRLVMHLTAD
jgi:secondary thiamine-phosphate synthase enzyme